eukprot:2471346-Rhodomonas_salina.1
MGWGDEFTRETRTSRFGSSSPNFSMISLKLVEISRLSRGLAGNRESEKNRAQADAAALRYRYLYVFCNCGRKNDPDTCCTDGTRIRSKV